MLYKQLKHTLHRVSRVDDRTFQEDRKQNFTLLAPVVALNALDDFWLGSALERLRCNGMWAVRLHKACPVRQILHWRRSATGLDEAGTALPVIARPRSTRALVKTSVRETFLLWWREADDHRDVQEETNLR